MFFGAFPTSRKNAAPHENTVNSSENVDRVAATKTKFDRKSAQKFDGKLHLIFDVFLKVLGVILEGFWEHFGIQKTFQIRA